MWSYAVSFMILTLLLPACLIFWFSYLNNNALHFMSILFIIIILLFYFITISYFVKRSAGV